MANHSLPTLTSTYTNFLTEVGARIDDAIKQGRSDTVTLTNPPVGTVRFNTSTSLWEQNTGTVGTPAWTALAATYGISISGSAAKWTTARTITLGTDLTGNVSLDGSANVTLNATLNTVTAAKGGTGQTTYAVGDLLYANTTTTLAKLADVATGSALISGGVGVAPSWGKVELTTHISGVLPTANGGTNLSSFTSGGAVYATSTSALTTGTLPLTAGGTGGTTQATALQALGAIGSQTVAKSATYNVVDGDRGDVLLCTGTWALTLTAAATLANGFSVGVVNVGTGTITIDPSGAELVDGIATKALTPGQSCILITDGTAWRTVGLSGGGAKGGGADDIFYENGQTVNTDYTITSGKNAMSAGPITIGSGITVTVPSGSNWAIV